jgi:hypothetical protein
MHTASYDTAHVTGGRLLQRHWPGCLYGTGIFHHMAPRHWPEAYHPGRATDLIDSHWNGMAAPACTGPNGATGPGGPVQHHLGERQHVAKIAMAPRATQPRATSRARRRPGKRRIAGRACQILQTPYHLQCVNGPVLQDLGPCKAASLPIRRLSSSRIGARQLVGRNRVAVASPKPKRLSTRWGKCACRAPN